jgi:hypothetical protein
VLAAERRDYAKLIRKLRHKHLEAAVALSKAPGAAVDYAGKVRRLGPTRAAQWLDKLLTHGGPIAFDYECNMLKPDGPDAEIVSCSVCWKGKRTIAFPWAEPAITAMRRVLRAPISKIAANLKFEERWSMAKVGTRVRDWEWDTMQTAHLLDNRPLITGLKFQAFVRLGVEPWDHHIKPFLEAPTPRTKNRIRELDLNDVLLYNGIDSAVEYDLAMLQAKDMKMSIV